jgi:hypothetical protein
MRAGPFLLLLALTVIPTRATAAQSAQLAGHVRRLLVICHVRDAARANLLFRQAGWEAEPISGRQEARGAYGRIAIATGVHPCELSFDLAAGTMADVRRIVHLWARANDAAPTFRDPRVVGGRKAIWALRRSTLRLEQDEAPGRFKLTVSYFPAH